MKVTFTKTSTFIFPLLNIPRELFKVNLTNFGKVTESTRFVNAYIYNEQKPMYNEHVSIVISSYIDKDYDNFYKELHNHPNYADEYISNGTLVMIFEIPEENMVDYQLIKKGRYSQVSEKGKDLILKNFFFDFKPSTIPLIFAKAKPLKTSWEKMIGKSIEDQEVWSIMIEQEETLTSIKLNGNAILKPSEDF